MTGKKLTDAGISAMTTPTDDDLMYVVDAPGTTPASKKITWANIKATLKTYLDTLYVPLPAPSGGSNSICDGRLTLTTAVPVTTADVTGATNVYFTPYKGNKIALYDGVSAWNIRSFTELTLALGTVTSGLPYDVFIYDNSGTPAIEKLAWTSGTARATALTLQDGVLVKSGATTRRYVGTIYTTSTTATEDSEKSRYVFNYYNRVTRTLFCQDTTATWTYTTATIRAANANTTLGQGRCAAIIGWADVEVNLVNQCSVQNASAAGAECGIGVDSTSANSNRAGGTIIRTTATQQTMMAIYRGFPAVGFHYFQRTEISEAAGTTTWTGQNNTGGGVVNGAMMGSFLG